MIQQYHSWAYIQKNVLQDVVGAPAHHVYCSTIYSSQAMETAQMPTSDEWIKKMWYVYTIEFYSVMKKNKIMLFVGKLHVKQSQSSSKKSKVTCFHSYVEARLIS
jgi:hypothetical protein